MEIAIIGILYLCGWCLSIAVIGAYEQATGKKSGKTVIFIFCLLWPIFSLVVLFGKK